VLYYQWQEVPQQCLVLLVYCSYGGHLYLVSIVVKEPMRTIVFNDPVSLLVDDPFVIAARILTEDTIYPPCYVCVLRQLSAL